MELQNTTPQGDTAPVTISPSSPDTLGVPKKKNTWFKPLIAFCLGIIVAVVGYRGYLIITTPVAAVVNGTRITMSELDRDVDMMKKSAALQGLDVTDTTLVNEIRTQALENLIMNALLLGEAKKQDVATSDEEITTAYTELAESVGGEETLLSRMDAVGLTKETLMKNIADRLHVDAYLEAVTDIETLEITDDEVKAYVASMESAGLTMPPLEEVGEQIKASLLAEKQQELINTHITELRAGADIEIRISTTTETGTDEETGDTPKEEETQDAAEMKI